MHAEILGKWMTPSRLKSLTKNSAQGLRWDYVFGALFRHLFLFISCLDTVRSVSRFFSLFFSIFFCDFFFRFEFFFAFFLFEIFWERLLWERLFWEDFISWIPSYFFEALLAPLLLVDSGCAFSRMGTSLDFVRTPVETLFWTTQNTTEFWVFFI